MVIQLNGPAYYITQLVITEVDSTHMTIYSLHRMLLEALFGSRTRARVLLNLHESEESWPRRIAREVGVDVNAVQSQLVRLQSGGVVISERRGRRRMYRLNPGYPLHTELRALLARVAAPAFSGVEDGTAVRDDRFALVRRLPDG